MPLDKNLPAPKDVTQNVTGHEYSPDDTVLLNLETGGSEASLKAKLNTGEVVPFSYVNASELSRTELVKQDIIDAGVTEKALDAVLTAINKAYGTKVDAVV